MKVDDGEGEMLVYVVANEIGDIEYLSTEYEQAVEIQEAMSGRSSFKYELLRGTVVLKEVRE